MKVNSKKTKGIESNLQRIFVVLLMVIVSIAYASQRPLSITRIAMDKTTFEPARDEVVTIRYRISQPATVLITFSAPDGQIVRSIKQVKSSSGEQLFRWDGRNNQGKLVPPEAYIFKIFAKNVAGEEVVYDQSLNTGGDTVYPQKLLIDINSRKITYQLQKASRIRLIVSSKGSYWPVRTILDWVPRGKGKHTEEWDGWDADHIVNALESEDMVPIMYAYSLPNNAVNVKETDGNSEPSNLNAHTETILQQQIPLINPLLKFRTEDGDPIHFHASHLWARCYNPNINAYFPKELSLKESNIPIINQPTTISFDIADKQPRGRARPISRISVFIFVDGQMEERMLSGYAPYQWIIDPTALTPGEHIITGVFAWRDDHFGLVHKKIWISPSRKSQDNQFQNENNRYTEVP